MTILGIDPGASGGIAIVGVVTEAVKMPDTERDLIELVREYARQADRAVIERVSAMPGNGVAGMFKFGMSYGALRMALIAVGIPFEAVTPAKWQSGLGVPKRGGKTKTQHKNVLKAKAQELFPALKITHATADALLIAEWGRRNRP